MKGQIYVGQAFFFPPKSTVREKNSIFCEEKRMKTELKKGILSWKPESLFWLKCLICFQLKSCPSDEHSDSQRPENKISCGSSSSRRINLHVSGDSKTSGAISEFLWMQMLQTSFKVRLRVFSSVADRPDVNPLFMLRVDATGMLFFIVTHYFCVITVCSRRHDSSSGTHTYLSV